ncbi:MAG: lysine--tRNA ligase [Proteobacteria bacterium]|nr:lysine--tRNA ligase [Pseudomonadota bacterium]
MSYELVKAWPFEEARRIVDRLNNKTPEKGYILLETGYGPSGLPHIGTFGEVARTSMVRHALKHLTDIPVRLFCFSDDMDGLRKVPDNVPNQEMLRQHIGKPLTSIPDPFEKFDSFGAHNNAMLCRFLDSFGFEYEFKSATDFYKNGLLDNALKRVLERYDEIMNVILPTLGEERRATYSPFLPVCPKTGVVLQVPMVERKLDSYTVVYKDPLTDQFVETPVTGGNCKLQWKVDWGTRWYALEVDYEMSGKDLIDSVTLSSKVSHILGRTPPLNLTYEHFLDEEGQKISKSKGNGLTIDDWLKYAPHESLAYYMYQTPKRAKRLYFDVIPKTVDDYLTFSEKYKAQSNQEQLENPVWHIHQGDLNNSGSPLSFNILLNLASVCNSEDPSVLWGFVQKYRDSLTPESYPFLDKLISYAIRYYQGFIKPNKIYKIPTEVDVQAMQDLKKELTSLSEQATAEECQAIVFEIGKRYPYDDLRSWFKSLYEVLLGQTEGPRMGSFIALYGVQNMIHLIEKKIG